jgi:toxin ParE1/3/4
MRQARLSARAQADLEDLWFYIAQDRATAADRFVDRILKACQNLARAPRIGRSREDLAPGLRSFAFENYIIFYRMAKSGVEIVRVLSGYRDIDVLFDF